MMRRLLRALGAAFVWVCCVAGVATAASFAINSAGRQVTLPVVDSGVVPAPTGSVTGTTPTRGTHLGTAATPPPEPSTSTLSATGSTPSRSRSTGIAPASSPTTVARTDTSPQPPPQPAPITDVVQTSGGSVELECVGTQVTDYLAQPAGGWSGMAHEDSSSLVSVLFTRHESSIIVHASCSSGRPRFSVSRTHNDD